MVWLGLLEMEQRLRHIVARFGLESSNEPNQHTHNLIAHNLTANNLSIGSHNSSPGDDGVAWTALNGAEPPAQCCKIVSCNF
jgi:hypothetical protein